jgi:hypothetical protein
MRFLLAAAVFFSGFAYADPPETSEDVQIRYRSRTEIDFEGVEVEGSLVRPQGSLILDRKKGAFNPLIRLREEFNEEITDSSRLIR